MKKRYKLLERKEHVYILHWQTDGMLFGPEWGVIAKFSKNEANLERCREIIRLMNDCDRQID